MRLAGIRIEDSDHKFYIKKNKVVILVYSAGSKNRTTRDIIENIANDEYLNLINCINKCKNCVIDVWESYEKKLHYNIFIGLDLSKFILSKSLTECLDILDNEYYNNSSVSISLTVISYNWIKEE